MHFHHAFANNFLINKINENIFDKWVVRTIFENYWFKYLWKSPQLKPIGFFFQSFKTLNGFFLKLFLFENLIDFLKQS
jgi:hypothetical protein